MNHVRVLLASLLVTASFLSNANVEKSDANAENGVTALSPCFITNKSGHAVRVELWKKRGSESEDSFVLSNNSMTDIIGLRNFEINPEDYYLRFVYVDSEGRLVHRSYQSFPLQYFAGQNIVLFRPHSEAYIILATEKMIEASASVEHSTAISGPFLVAPAQKELFYTGIGTFYNKVLGKINYSI